MPKAGRSSRKVDTTYGPRSVSVTFNIVLLPCREVDNGPVKSKLTSRKGISVTLMGLACPAGALLSGLLLWQLTRVVTNQCMSSNMRGQ
eukprot:1769175-Rhodomonas_salina.1